jgi:serine/threonine-protein kinase RsbW
MASEPQQVSQPFRQRDIAQQVNTRESNSEPLACRFQGSTAIAQATETARTFGKSQNLGDDDLARLCIVIEELVANLFDHGGLTEEDEIELLLAADPAGIRVTMLYPGSPFDPWVAPQNPQLPDRGGGAGLALIRAWAQLLSYGSSDEGNRLECLLSVRRQG